MGTDIRRALKGLLPHLIEAQTSNLNEADTVLRVLKFFENVLGYDPFKEIGREAQLKNKYIDMVIKIDGVVKLLVEVKAAGTELRERHIEQAQAYGARNNYRWVVLTNGVVWTLYRLSFEEGIEAVEVFSVDLSKEDALETAVDPLSLLHRDSIRDNAHEEYFSKKTALSAESIAKAIFHEDCLRSIRKEIRRNEGILADLEDLAAAIRNMFSVETRELIGVTKIKWQKQQKRPKEEDMQPSAAAISATPSATANPDGADKQAAGGSDNSTSPIPRQAEVDE